MAQKHERLSKSDINIGIIGPHFLINKTKETLKDFPNFKAIFRTVEQIDDITLVTKDLMEHVEVLMFTELYSYERAKQTVKFTVPAHFMIVVGIGLYQALFSIKNNINLKTISIDTVETKYVKQILDEFDEENFKLIDFETIEHQHSISDFVRFHENNFYKHGSIAFTGIHEVANQLSERNIPHKWITPTKQDMIISLERALLATETRRIKESQIVFGLVNIDNFKKVVNKYTTDHDVQLLRLNLQQMLLDYIKHLDGHLISLGGDEYFFITTRGIFERHTRGYKFLPILEDVKDKLSITLSLGIGFGLTAAEAGQHARLALQQSKESGGNICYIVREDRSVLGPIDVMTHTQYEKYDLSITDPNLLEKAEQAGMSASYMTRIMEKVARHRKIDYTAQDLASTLQVTIRSAHRILLKWMDAELVEIIGEEKVTHKGRPRRIYRLIFIDKDLLE